MVKTKRFKPGLALTVSAFVAFAILCTLGTWQALKVGPKTKMLELMHAQLLLPAVPLPEDVSVSAELKYRHVSVSGERIADPVKVFGTNIRGHSGYYLYAPVRRPSGRIIIVNYGWIPMQHDTLPVLPEGNQKTTGVLLESAKAGSMTPPNKPEMGDWFTADITELATHFGYDVTEVYSMRLLADHAPQNETGLPLGGQVRIDIPNNHLEYTLTWYGLALGLLVIYILLGIKRAEA